VLEGAASVVYGGIPGFFVGFVHGAIHGAAGAVAYEAGNGLVELNNQNYSTTEAHSTRTKRPYNH
jgi:hypothetical protein